MKTHSRILLSDSNVNSATELTLFAFLNLGLVQSLTSGALSPAEAIRCFYHADNCLYVREHFQSRVADAIMSRGVQLPDLFAHLPPEEARRALFCELEAMRASCLQLLERERALV